MSNREQDYQRTKKEKNCANISVMACKATQSFEPKLFGQSNWKKSIFRIQKAVLTLSDTPFPKLKEYCVVGSLDYRKNNT